MKRAFFIPMLLLGILPLTGCSTSESTGTASPMSSAHDCGKDMSCFVAASATCSESRVHSIVETNMFGILQETDSSFGLSKSADGRCVLSLVTNNIEFRYSKDRLDKMKADGLTPDQIEQQLQKIDAQYEALIGQEGSCLGETSTISALLKRWQVGSFSTSDWNDLDCSGPYFDQMSQ